MTQVRQQPTHSFVVCAYRESSYLEECLRSLQEQTFASQILIATSTPSSFLEKVSDNFGVPLWINPVSAGLAADWTFAYSASETDLVTLAHQDDVYAPRFAEESVNAFKANNTAALSFTDYLECDENGCRPLNLTLRVKKILLAPMLLSNNVVTSRIAKRLLLSLGSPIPCPAVTYNRKILGNFQFNSDFKINVDWDAWLRIADISGAIVRVPLPLMSHRIHSISATTTGLNSNARQYEDLVIFRKLWPRPISDLLAKLYSLSYASNES